MTYTSVVEKKTGKPLTICGLPVMAIEDEKGNRINPKIEVRSLETGKKRAYTIPADIRLVPLTKELSDWMEAFNMTVEMRDWVNNMTLVVVLKKQFLPFLKTHLHLIQRVVHYAVLGDCDNLNMIPTLVQTICKEMGKSPVETKILMDYASEAVHHLSGMYPGAQGDASVVEYQMTMLAICSYIDGCSPKDIVNAEYKMMTMPAWNMLLNIRCDVAKGAKRAKKRDALKAQLAQ